MLYHSNIESMLTLISIFVHISPSFHFHLSGLSILPDCWNWSCSSRGRRSSSSSTSEEHVFHQSLCCSWDYEEPNPFWDVCSYATYLVVCRNVQLCAAGTACQLDHPITTTSPIGVLDEYDLDTAPRRTHKNGTGFQTVKLSQFL
jgi:hypothetical protein